MPPPKPYAAFVACKSSGTIAIVDLSSLKTIASTPVPSQPVRVLARPASHEVFSFSAGGKIAVIDFPSRTLERQFTAGKSAQDPWFSPDGKRLYVLDSASGDIVTVDAESGEIIGRVKLPPGLADLALTPDGKTLVASDPRGNRLFFADSQSGKVLGSAGVGKGPGPLAILPDSSKVFVADTDGDKVSAVDLNNRSLVANIEIDARPHRLALKPDGGELFVFSGDPPTMTIIDTSQDDVEQDLPTGQGVSGAVFRQDSSMMYLSTAGNGFVSFFDVAKRTVTSAVEISALPGVLALTPDQRFLAVAGTTSASLMVLEANPPLLIAVVPVGADPVDVSIPGWLVGR
jgi:DNA-binding beta-propeller fold protein YncE